MNAFTTHASVRIKGTENNYEPVQCSTPKCPVPVPHMHCPFCVKTENYHDPVILKAHYRVKHVDKGIEFAGLKILRCCDHCDIVGTIKGTKEFKGAHWHCYRCRNGFNRRDEALKHYRTHFRNPQTTFQIQIAQEVNQQNVESDNAATTITQINQDDSAENVISPCSLTTGYTTIHQTDGSHVNGKDGEIQVSVAANETVGAEGQTIMIIQADEHLDATQVQNALNNSNIQEVTSLEYSGVIEEERSKWEQKLKDLQQKYDQAEAEYKGKEQKLESEIADLKEQIQSQATLIASLQKREQELLSQLSIPLDSQIHQLLVQLKSEHEELLHQQLAQIRRSYIQQIGQQAVVESSSSSETSGQANIVFVQSPGGSNIGLVQDGNSGCLADGDGAGEGRYIIVKSEEVKHHALHREEAVTQDEDGPNSADGLVIRTNDIADTSTARNDEEAERVIHVKEIKHLESLDSDTVVHVTLTSAAQQPGTLIDDSCDQDKFRTDEKDVSASPRSKRRKKSN